MRGRLRNARNAAVEHYGQAWMGGLEPMDAAVVERRHVAVLARRQALEPGLAGMHDEPVDARALDRAREGLERLLRILRVDADAAVDRHRHRHLPLHGGPSVPPMGGLRPPAGT